MESIGSFGEVTEVFQIPNFSQYSTADKVHSTVSVVINDFSSRWLLTVVPKQLDNSKIDSLINCDVIIQLECKSCNVPLLYTETIEIICTIDGRENYPKKIKHKMGSHCPLWKDTLISRAALQLSSSDVFQFQIQFRIPEQTVAKSENGSKYIIIDLGNLLNNPEYFDTCISTSTGTKFLAHAAILHSRSNILQTANLNLHSSLSSNTLESYDIKSESGINIFHESVINSPRNCKDKHSSILGYLSTSVGSSNDISSNYNAASPCKRKPLFTLNSNAPKVNNQTPSPSSSSVTPRKRGGMSGTPKKKSVHSEYESPSRHNQTQLTDYFQRSSSLKSESEVKDVSSSTPYKLVLSPMKYRTVALTCKNESDSVNYSQRLSTDCVFERTVKNCFSPLNRSKVINSPCGTKPLNNFQTPKRKLFEETEVCSTKLITVRVNMSTSVTQELLQWIYTGESSRLAELSRPLLVAALRHEVSGLARAAQLQLSASLNLENATELLLLGHKYEATLLKEEALRFAVAYASEITALSSWSELSVRYPELLLEFTRHLAVKSLGEGNKSEH